MGAASYAVFFYLLSSISPKITNGQPIENKQCSPFVQRVWAAVEAKDIPYVPVDCVHRDRSVQEAPIRYLLEVNPRGLVSAIRHGDWGCHES